MSVVSGGAALFTCMPASWPVAGLLGLFLPSRADARTLRVLRVGIGRASIINEWGFPVRCGLDVGVRVFSFHLLWSYFAMASERHSESDLRHLVVRLKKLWEFFSPHLSPVLLCDRI